LFVRMAVCCDIGYLHTCCGLVYRPVIMLSLRVLGVGYHGVAIYADDGRLTIFRRVRKIAKSDY